MKLFLIAILVVAVLVVSGCTQSTSPTKSPVNPSPTSTPHTTQSSALTPAEAASPTSVDTPTSSTPKTSGDSTSDKTSTLTYLQDDKTSNSLDFNYVDTEKVTATATGYIAKDSQSPIERYYFTGKLDWTFDMEKIIDDECEVRIVHDSGTRQLLKEDTQILVSGGYYIAQFTIPELEVKEKREIKAGCGSHTLIENPYNFGKRLFSYAMSPKNPTVDGKNIKASDEKITKGQPGDTIVRDSTIRYSWDLSLP